MTRDEAMSEVAAWLCGLEVGHPVRVAVDGITAAGKSTLAGELADAVTAAGRPGLHLSTDDYHHQRERRHRQGRLSADGYYDDAYDLGAFRDQVLVPLGPGRDRRYRARHHDLDTDEILDGPLDEADARAVVAVDGSFLQRPELAGHWDAVIWVETSFHTALARALVRDDALFGGAEATREAYELRYHAACRRYLNEVSPHPFAAAALVFGNEDLARPVLTWRRRH